MTGLPFWHVRLHCFRCSAHMEVDAADDGAAERAGWRLVGEHNRTRFWLCPEHAHLLELTRHVVAVKGYRALGSASSLPQRLDALFMAFGGRRWERRRALSAAAGTPESAGPDRDQQMLDEIESLLCEANEREANGL